MQYAPSVEEPVSCHICDEERQYVNPKGQSWTTLESLQIGDTYKNEIIEEEDGLYSITTKPGFAIGQTAFVVKTESYRLLWDCITYLDETTIAKNKRAWWIRCNCIVSSSLLFNASRMGRDI